MNRRNTRKNTGFSFTEILLNMVFVLLLAGIAVPSFSDYLATNEIFSQRQNFNTTLLDARNEAMSLHATVSICPLSVSGACATDWSYGWISFQDDGRGKSGVANDGILNGKERIIHIHRGDDITKVFVKDVENDLNLNSISFNGLGRPSEAGREVKAPILIAVCNKSKTLELARGLLLSSKGFVERTRDFDNDGIQESFNSKINKHEYAGTEYSLRCA